jgi:hypothetical protein
MINPTMDTQLLTRLPRLGHNLTLGHSFDRLGYVTVGQLSQSGGGEGIEFGTVAAVGTGGGMGVIPQLSAVGGGGVKLGEGEVFDLSQVRRRVELGGGEGVSDK